MFFVIRLGHILRHMLPGGFNGIQWGLTRLLSNASIESDPIESTPLNPGGNLLEPGNPKTNNIG